MSFRVFAVVIRFTSIKRNGSGDSRAAAAGSQPHQLSQFLVPPAETDGTPFFGSYPYSTGQVLPRVGLFPRRGLGGLGCQLLSKCALDPLRQSATIRFRRVLCGLLQGGRNPNRYCRNPFRHPISPVCSCALTCAVNARYNGRSLHTTSHKRQGVCK